MPEQQVRFSYVDRLILGLLSLGLGTLLFHADPDFGPVAQGLGISLVLGAGLLAAHAGYSKTRLSPVEICVLAMAVLSLLSNFLGVGGVSDETWGSSVTFSALLLLLVLTNAALIRRYGPDPVFRCSAWVLALGALYILSIDFDAVIRGLTTDAAERWNYRLAPLGLHPNLAGIIFSLAITLSLYQAVTRGRGSQLFFAFVALTQASIVAATGSRGGVLACVVSIGLVVILKYRALPVRLRAPLPLLTAAGVAIVVLYWRQIYSLLAQIFELETETRGWDSGATGRVERWAQGLDYIFSDTARLVMGSGLRTAGPSEIGFSTESSYITILIESGIPLAVVFFGCLIATILRLYAQTPRDPVHLLTNLGALAVVQFAIIESLFNRYLLAIGNPASIVFLLIFVGAWLNANYQLSPRSDRGLNPSGVGVPGRAFQQS